MGKVEGEDCHPGLTSDLHIHTAASVGLHSYTGTLAHMKVFEKSYVPGLKGQSQIFIKSLLF